MEHHQCDCPNCPEHFRRIVYLIRDGRDVLCSYFHFQRHLGEIPKQYTFQEFLVEERYPGRDWDEHVRGYLDLAANRTASAKVMLVRYGQLTLNVMQPSKKQRVGLQVCVMGSTGYETEFAEPSTIAPHHTSATQKVRAAHGSSSGNRD